VSSLAMYSVECHMVSKTTTAFFLGACFTHSA
jgi:hypothetical protein